LPPASQRSGVLPNVVIETGADGLHLRTHLGEVAVAFHQPGACATEAVVLPITALQDLEARTDEKIALESVGAGKVKARWHEGVVPRIRHFTTTETEQPEDWPALPQHFTQLPVKFLGALEQARQSAARDAARYALHRILLRGATGEVMATDGRQLLIQSGFALPWPADVLIPAVAFFGGRELAQSDPVQLGKTDTHVCLRAGSWTFCLRIDGEGRYPRVDEVIPRPDSTATRCRLESGDAAFLKQTLSRLVDGKDADQPITLDLNGRVVVRSRPEGQEHSTEVVLGRSTVSGPAVRLATSGLYLQRAVDLGLTDLQIDKPEAPVLAERPGLRMVWMPLGKAQAVPPSSNPHQVYPPVQERKPQPGLHRREPQQHRRRAPTPAPMRLAPAPQPTPPSGTPADASSLLWRFLRTCFLPRGRLWRGRQHQ
jgi:hypothetical protein